MTIQDIIDRYDNIVFFGGAGVSTRSGIPDFRGKNGIYKRKKKFSECADRVLSLSFFNEHKAEFYNFFREYCIYKSAKPNIVHEKLADLEKTGKLKAIITQNIDGLHQKAGSRNVIEIHGSAYKSKCINCEKEYDTLDIIGDNEVSDYVPKCNCGGYIKPCVTLYEESLDDDKYCSAMEYINKCQALIVGGTSLIVPPASRLIDYFSGDIMVLINETSIPLAGKFDNVILDDICNVFNELIIR